MNILYAGFEGRNNSSKILLDTLNCDDKLYLKNNKQLSCEQIENLLKAKSYDYVLLFGQKPIIKNKLSIEQYAKKDTILESNIDTNALSLFLTSKNINNYISQNAGTSYCNNIYYFTLNYIKSNNLNTKAVFIHIPYIKNFDNLKELANVFNFNDTQ